MSIINRLLKSFKTHPFTWFVILVIVIGITFITLGIGAIAIVVIVFIFNKVKKNKEKKEFLSISGETIKTEKLYEDFFDIVDIVMMQDIDYINKSLKRFNSIFNKYRSDLENIKEIDFRHSIKKFEKFYTDKDFLKLAFTIKYINDKLDYVISQHPFIVSLYKDLDIKHYKKFMKNLNSKYNYLEIDIKNSIDQLIPAKHKLEEKYIQYKQNESIKRNFRKNIKYYKINIDISLIKGINFFINKYRNASLE